MDNPRYEAQHLTLKGFFETGIWVIARIMLLPTLIFAGMIYFDSGENSGAGGMISQAFSPASAAAESFDLSSIIGGGSSSSGRMLGFGVGSAPISPGAKWVRPGADSTRGSTGAKWVRP